ncbi:DUF397 domain-containing protein [Actinomadura sp. SCN-SB]|uniref:DUF397 domain-containing protein n=1 Tax=Actinomadura sp. SCN-SB TaxID=3373092 RepID=UPI0037518525
MLDRTNRGVALNWRKSSASGEGQDQDCVEVAAVDRSVLVRDSHDPSGGMIVLDSVEWRAFLRRIVDGVADRR